MVNLDMVIPNEKPVNNEEKEDINIKPVVDKEAESVDAQIECVENTIALVLSEKFWSTIPDEDYLEMASEYWIDPIDFIWAPDNIIKNAIEDEEWLAAEIENIKRSL